MKRTILFFLISFLSCSCIFSQELVRVIAEAVHTTLMVPSHKIVELHARLVQLSSLLDGFRRSFMCIFSNLKLVEVFFYFLYGYGNLYLLCVAGVLYLVCCMLCVLYLVSCMLYAACVVSCILYDVCVVSCILYDVCVVCCVRVVCCMLYVVCCMFCILYPV